MVTMMERAHEQYLPGVPTDIQEVTTPLSHALIQAHKDFPERVAIDFLGRNFTYDDIYKQVQQAVTALAMCGVRPGDCVSLILPNCPQHYVAFYAIQALGAIASEHNPLAPREQLIEQLERVGSRVVIAWEKTIETLAAGSIMGYTFLAVDLTKALPSKSQFLLKLPLKAAQAQRAKLRGKIPPGVHSWDNQVSHAKPMHLESIPDPDLDDVAVLIQTGGTTGTPKSVQLTHRNIVANATQVLAWLKQMKRAEETVGAVLPFFHAFGLQLSLSVCVNLAATQVMLPSFDVDMLLAAHKRHPITFFGGVPPMFKRILDAVDKLPEHKKPRLDSIRYSISGAMALDPALAERWEKATDGFLIEGYGMTEASPVISGSPLSAQRRPSTLGLPFPSTEVKIVNPEDISEVYGEGTVGELLVRGPQVFTGYLNDPEETALALTEDGFLRTGDLARWDDGFLVMADRRKEMIINGGFNIYPSEVEAALRDMPGVRDVAVVGMPVDSKTEAVVAALVLEPGAAVDLASVRAWAEKKISHYALPKSIAVLDDLPRSQLGKTLRKNVKESLSTWELNHGEWKEKLSAVQAVAAKRAEIVSDALKGTMEALNEAISDTTANLRDKVENLNEVLAETTEALKGKSSASIESTGDKDKDIFSETEETLSTSEIKEPLDSDEKAAENSNDTF